MDDTRNTPPADHLATEHVHVDDIGTQLINIESVQQTIKEHVSELESSGMAASVLKLKSLLPKLDSLQISIRKTFDAHARLLIQDTHIFDLPDELLRKIFQHVAGSLKMRSDYGVTAPSEFRSIMSCRLVCHRFCDTSSHLLLYKLDVPATNASLAHLDEVSRHPTISLGVKSLRICVSLFDSSIAHSFKEFAVECTSIMQRSLGLWEAMLEASRQPDFQFLGEMSFGGFSPPRFTGDILLTMMNLPQRVEQFSPILDSWNRYIGAGASEQDGDEYVAALHQAYERYKKLISDQQALIQNKTFFRRIATAVARMPTIADLSIHDGARYGHDWRSIELNSIDEIVQHAILKPGRWSLGKFEQIGQPSVDFLYQLPLEVGQSGSLLTALHINFTPQVDVKLRLDEKEVGDVLKATQHLQVLDISCFSGATSNQANQRSEESTSLSRLVSLFMQAPSLRDVGLNFMGWQPDPQAQGAHNEGIGKTISLLPWTKLREVSLGYLSIRFGEFTTCLEQLEPGACIILDTVNLLTGTWADLLDVLRTKADCASEVITPLGGELEELDSIELYDEYFLATDDAESLATQYVSGILSENPLRQHHGDSDTDETGEQQE